MPEDLFAGRYRLGEPLGHGGMSEVWSATDTELGRRVALKFLAPHADTARFEREARAIASLSHPNVAQLYDYGTAEGRPFMVLEYLPGGTLEERLRDGRPLPDGETARIANEVAAGLAHAHARGVVHRDLKPANVLFDEDGRAKLADFGIARVAAGEGTLTDAGTVLGTAAYISPEQATGEPATAASDVYSFGVILYRMLTGRLPFASNDPLTLVALHRDAEPPPVTRFRRDAPSLLARAAAAALAKDPTARPRDGRTLLAVLGVPAADDATAVTGVLRRAESATRVLPSAAAAPTHRLPGAAPRRRRTPLVVAALAVLVLAGVALAYGVSRSSNGKAPTSSSRLPTVPTTRTTTPTTTAPTTTAAPPTTTAPTTTAPTTTAQPTTAPTTTAPTPLPTTTAPLPTTTVTPPTVTPPTVTAPTITAPSVPTTP
jgi:serine/threonine-protein kinase